MAGWKWLPVFGSAAPEVMYDMVKRSTREPGATLRPAGGITNTKDVRHANRDRQDALDDLEVQTHNAKAVLAGLHVVEELVRTPPDLSYDARKDWRIKRRVLCTRCGRTVRWKERQRCFMSELCSGIP